jgi:hypothetical protein
MRLVRFVSLLLAVTTAIGIILTIATLPAPPRARPPRHREQADRDR